MSHGSLDDDAVESYREAGAVLVEAMNEAREMVEPGRTHLEVAEWTEDFIREQDAGLAFPVNISVDPEASPVPPRVATTTPSSARRWCVSTSASTSTATSPTPRSRWTTRGPRAGRGRRDGARGRGRRGRAGCRGRRRRRAGDRGRDPRVRLHARPESLRTRRRAPRRAHGGRRSRTAASIGRSNWSPDRRLRSSRSPPTAAGRSARGPRRRFSSDRGRGASATAARDRPSTRSRRSTTSRSRRGGWKATA